MSISFNVLCDWANDNNFSGTHDDITSYVIGEISFSRGKDQARTVSPPAAGHLTLRLNNTSRLFSVENESSALHGDLLPGRKIQIKGAGVALWTGYIDDILPDAASKTVTLTAKGPLSKLAGRKISTELHESILVNDAIEEILTAVGLTSADWDLDTADVALDHWQLSEQDAMEALVALWDTEGPPGSMYEGGDGKIIFEGRSYRTTESRCTSSQFTFTDTDHITDAGYTPDYKDISNECTIPIDIRAYEVGVVIWELNEQIVFSNNETKTWILQTREPFKNAIAPSPAPSNASQTLTPSVTLTGGAFKLRFQGQTTASINYNDTAATIQSKIDAILGSGTTIVTGSLSTTLRITFIGVYGGQAITDKFEVVESTLNPASVTATIAVNSIQRAASFTGAIEIQGISAEGLLTGGTYTIGTPLGTTAAINWNDSISTIQTKIRAIFGLGSTLVNGSSLDTGTSYVINFVDVSTSPWPDVTITPSSLTRAAAGALLNVEITSQGGESDYTVSSGTITSRSVSPTSGTNATVSMTAGASGATINRTRVRGDLFTIIRSEQVKNNNDLSASIADHGIRPENHRVLSGISRSVAQTRANLGASFYANPRPSLPFVIPSKNATLATQITTRKVSDRITATEGQTGVNDPYFIEHIGYRLIPSSVVGEAEIIATFGCEKVL